MVEQLTGDAKREQTILKAIDTAENAGMCMYLHDDDLTPCCVVAKLHVLEGGNPRDMVEWEGRDVPEVIQVFHPISLAAYPDQLLNDLQGIWDSAYDCGEPEDETVLRERMKRRVRVEFDRLLGR